MFRFLLEGNQILWIALPVVENNEDLRILDIVDYRIVEVRWIIRVLCWRRDEALSTLSVFTNKNFSQVHISVTTDIWRRIRGPR